MDNIYIKELDRTIDLNYIRSLHIRFELPAANGMFYDSFVRSLLDWSIYATKLGITWSYNTLTTESLITRGRNTCVASFLSSDATHLVFIDVDISWQWWQVLLLLDDKKELIGAACPLKSLPITYNINLIENAIEDKNGLIEVERVGTGFMVISREVFSKLESHPEVVSYNPNIKMPKEWLKYNKTYFSEGVRNNVYMSEDYQFCNKYKDVGGNIYINKNIVVGHTGLYEYK
jgi:hypothetical protein